MVDGGSRHIEGVAGEPARASQRLGIRDAIRARPGMYIGGTGPRGIAHLAYELVANAIDQVLAGRAKTVELFVHRDRSIEVRDDGPGIDLADESTRRWFREGHDSATADGHHPHVHLAWPGSGLVAVTALAQRVVVTTTSNATTRSIEWRDGGDNESPVQSVEADQAGTSIRFWPDETIFGDAVLDARDVVGRLRELDALIPELRLSVFGEGFSVVAPTVRSWHDGIDSLLNSLDMPMDRFGSYRDSVLFRGSCSSPDVAAKGVVVPAELAVGLRQGRTNQERLALWCNYDPVIEESGLHRAFRRAFWRAAGNDEAAEAEEPPPLSGLRVVASLTMLDPEWGGPIKGRVDDPRAAAIVDEILAEHLPGVEAHDRTPLGPTFRRRSWPSWRVWRSIVRVLRR